jgi:hypothetical protein
LFIISTPKMSQNVDSKWTDVCQFSQWFNKKLDRSQLRLEEGLPQDRTAAVATVWFHSSNLDDPHDPRRPLAFTFFSGC